MGGSGPSQGDASTLKGPFNGPFKDSDKGPFTVNPRKLEHGFRRIGARIPYTLYLKGMRILCSNFLASTIRLP